MLMAKKINVGIIGGAGYTGGELIRLLIHHPHVSISFVHSKSKAGKPLSSVHQDLLGETDLHFTRNISSLRDGSGQIDLVFLCVGHGEAKKFLEEHKIEENIKIIDLSQDFRLSRQSAFPNRKFIYGLPELNREEISTAKNIANPGCFATAIQLGLLPLAKHNLLKEVFTTGITGSTGAGQSHSDTSHFSWRANNIQAYKTLSHQHLNEMHQSLHQLQTTFPIAPQAGADGSGVRFIPWRGDFTRGIFISSTTSCHLQIEELNDLYEDFYSTHPFTFLSKEPVSLKQVINSNKCIIQLEKLDNHLVIHSIIDNLVKGASGQAIQNMNLMFALDEKEGLFLKATAF